MDAGLEFFERDVGENRGFSHVLVVRADAEAHVEISAEVDADCSAGGLEFSVRAGDVEVGVVASLEDADALRGGDVRLHFVGVHAGCVAKLQRGKTVAVAGGVDVFRAGVERLTDEQSGLAVFVALRANERNVGGE